MKRIPVAESIRFAYTFTAGQIGAIIGLVWLPLVIVAMLQFLPYAIGTIYSADAADSAAAAGPALLNFLFSTAAFFLYAMNCVSVTRQALGLRAGDATFHFALGWPEWRMFAAIVICGLLLIGMFGIYLMAGTLPTLLPGAARTPLAGMLTEIYALVGLCAVICFALRLMVLVPSIVVAEERVDLVRAWTLTRGNTWRIFIVILAATLPLLLVQCVALSLLVGPALFAPLPANATAAAMVLGQRLALLDRHMPSVIGVSLMLAPFSLGLTLGAAASMYRALVPARSTGGTG